MWRFVWEVDGSERQSIVGSWALCWRLSQLYARLRGPGAVYIVKAAGG